MRQRTASALELNRLPQGQLVTSSVFINVLALALPVMTLQVYDRILPQNGHGTLTLLATGVAVAVVLETVLRLARSWLTGWQGAVYEYRMSCAAMGEVLATDLPAMKSRGAGEYLHQMQAITRLREFNSGYTTTTLIDIAFIPVFMGFVLYVAGPLAIVPAAGLMVMILISLIQGQNLRQRLQARDRADDQRYNFLIETLGALHTLKALTLEKLFQRRYEALEEKSARTNYATAEDTAAIFNACTVLSHAIVIGVITLGAALVLRQDITAGAMVATLLLSGRMMQMVQRGLVLWVKYQDARLSEEKAAHLFDPSFKSKPVGLPQTDAPPALGQLSVSNLKYGHDAAENDILSVDTLQISHGDIIWLDGASGSGKSTLLQLLAGVLTPRSGSITVDGWPVARYSARELARHIGYVSAEPVIFRGTIRHNITRFGDIDPLNARRAAAQLGIDKDIARLPLGFDTFLQGNVSDTIPPGLKQRISMARVVAATPGILLLDGADMTLDRHGQKFLVEYLNSIAGRITVVIVSEEPALQALATRRLHLAQGRLTETPITPPAKDEHA